MKDYALIYNPSAAAGKSKKSFQKAMVLLEEKSISFETFESEYAGHILTLAADLAKDGYRIIGCGGDGTCNEVINGVQNSGVKMPISFIPMGSGNDLPCALGIIPDVERACEIIAEGHTEKCDIGLATNSSGEKRYFLGIGSQGFDAEVTRRTNEGKKWLDGTMNYVSSIFKTLGSFKTLDVKVTMDNETYEGKSNLIAVGNGPSYGGGMYMCPAASIKDSIFHVTVIDNMSKFTLLMNFSKLYKKTHMALPEMLEYHSKKVVIEMQNKDDVPYFYQVDGEVMGPLPVTYEIVPGAQEFIMPKEDEVLLAFNKKYAKKIEKGKIPDYSKSFQD
ncbi:MAG: diacylglycerol/lipid kinase family protein [Candidatus Hodarchaeota archaeon]